MKLVWVIDTGRWTRASLAAELNARGFQAAGYDTVRDAIESLPERSPQIIVVDLRGQPPRLVERLLDIGVPVVIVGDGPDVDDQAPKGWAATLRRPVSIAQIAEEVERANPG